MLDVGVIGIGNTGNQIALTCYNRLGIPVVAINSSEKDLESLPNSIPKRLLKDRRGLSLGAGKDRKTAKSLLKESLDSIISDSEIINTFKNLDVLFVVSSTGGGTGSGTSPLMYEILDKTFKDVKIILVGVIPSIDETLDSQCNTIGYLKEVYKTLDNPTFMLYDNGKPDLPYQEVLTAVNENVCNDIDILRCTYNYTTQLDSIDDQDAKKILGKPGRIIVASVTDIKDKDIETSEMLETKLLNDIKKNAHVELQRDKFVMTRGFIANISPELSNVLNTSLPKINENIGEPLNAFKHISINESKEPNNIFVIMSGLSFIKDRLDTIGYRVSEIQNAMKRKDNMDDSDIFDIGDDIGQLLNDDEPMDTGEETLKASDIFSKFMD